MAQSKDDERERKRVELLTLYAATGSAREAARRVDIPERTAQRWVADAIESKDQLLADAGATLRARAIDSASRMAVDAIETARARGNDNDWCQSFKSDPGPSYLKLITDTLKTLYAAERLDAERGGELQTGPAVIVIEAGSTESDDDVA